MKPIVTFFFVFAFLSDNLFAQQDEEPCRLMLQNGLYKTFNIVRQSTFNQDLKTYFSSDEFKKDFKEGKWGGFLSVIVDAVPIKLGASASNAEISEFQKKVTQATSLTVDQKFYDYSYTTIPDVELARAYTDCIATSRKYGFKVNAVVNDKDVLFIVSYRNQVEGDPMPRVTRFEVRNGGNVSKSFNVGDQLKGETSINSERDAEKDLTLILETDRGVATYKVPADPSGFNKDFPVGTIITSYLNWTEFQVATKNNSNNPIGEIWSSKYSKWAPADGRQVPNSAFLRVTSQLNIPDLRGMFLRGLNQFDQDQPAIADASKKDPEDRSRGSYQSDAIKEHTHKANNVKFASAYGHGSDNLQGGSERRWSVPYNADIPVTILPQGDGLNPNETRPKNISVFYYIRIN